MRIVFVANFFPPTHTAGTETYTYGLARTLSQAGHDVRVVCAGTFDAGNSHYPSATTDEVDGIHVTRLHFNWQRADDIFMELADNVQAGGWFGAYLFESMPDIVHVTSCDTLSPRVIAVAKRLGIPVVVTLTDFWFLCMRHTLLRGDGSRCEGPESAWGCVRCLAHGSKALTIPATVFGESVTRAGLMWASTKPALTRQRGLRGVLGDVERRQDTVMSLLLEADMILAPTAFLREMFVRNGYPPERIIVSPYGLEYGWVPANIAKTPARALRIGYLGQIVPLKGIHLLVKAFRQLTAENVTLTLHGNLTQDSLYTAELKALAGDDIRIEFAGPFARTERAEVLRNLDIVVVPSRWYENAPFVIAEAQAMKTPVIAADLGGMAEVVRHEIDGMLFTADSVESLAHCLQWVADHPTTLDTWRANIRQPRTVSDDAGTLLRWYRDLIGTNAEEECLRVV